MSASFSTLRLDVVAAHGAAWDGGQVGRFRSGVSAVVERMERNIRAEHPSVQLRARCVTSEQACALGDEGVTCAVAVLDVTECDEQLTLYAGRLQGARVPFIVVCRVDAEEPAQPISLRSPDVKYQSVQ